MCDETTKTLYTFMYALSAGLFEVIFYVGWALALIIEMPFVANEVTNGNFDRPYWIADVIGVFLWIQFGSYLLGNSMPNLQIFKLGLKAIQSVMEVIDHIPQININNESLTPINWIDNIEYK